MASERKLERKLRRKEEKKGLVDTDDVSSIVVEGVPGETEDLNVRVDVAASEESVDSQERRDPGKTQQVMPIGELPSRRKSKSGKSPRKKKKRIEEQDSEPVEFRVNGIIVDRDVKGGAKENWMGVYMVLFRTSTPLGQRVAFILIGLVTISVSVAVLDSVTEIRDRIGGYLLVIEFGFTFLFTIEYGLRIACLRKPGKFIFSLLGFVDICALVPSYFAYIFPEARPLLHLAVLRIFRVMRVFRLMRLARFVDASAALTENIDTNRRNIAVFLVALFTVILVIGCAMYLIEGDRQFGNIPVSLYWTVVTITTVGYGDISPQTIVGRILATLVMFVGYGIIASPTLLSAPPSAPSTSEVFDCPKCTKVLECVRCFQKYHQESANFCCMCSEPLRKPELKALKVNGEERKRTPKSRAPNVEENGYS
ncbi:chloride channel family [Plasmopara halstedii]|uniref:Chloride channel family n=1 Tax=Plasmopara halstedii TaxID=4781 RepID=A0A0N7L4T7_PLAHL|nr:chloride channel family [Plasmopara halstedii]CEG39587.1 chloride channel family [Plasmopara halstedii]|eukprot:XP_024575956.1 chloride channel family [Plasmopara halstedii]